MQNFERDGKNTKKIKNEEDMPIFFKAYPLL